MGCVRWILFSLLYINIYNYIDGLQNHPLTIFQQIFFRKNSSHFFNFHRWNKTCFQLIGFKIIKHLKQKNWDKHISKLKICNFKTSLTNIDIIVIVRQWDVIILRIYLINICWLVYHRELDIDFDKLLL